MAYTIVAILLIGDVIGREVFNVSILGTKIIAVYTAIVAGFVGFSLATAANAHLRPEAFDRLVTGPAGDALARTGDAVTGVFYLVLAWFGFTFVQFSMEAGDRAAVLYFALWPIQLIIPYTFVSSAIRHFAFAWRPELKPNNVAGER